MRILVVSAHYPPDFVSGGTLVPQGLARGLRARGHDVSVYAGSVRGGHAPLSTWEDTDSTGLPVRWIAVQPYIGWQLRTNTQNPRVVADLAAHIRRVRPDVVHLHSLQALGGGAVRAAKEQGARVVVTMHDFWWVCARQFLATRDMVPCCLVVDAGLCPCEVDHRWLQRRNARLRDDLAYADLVLAPSASAAAVLRANGLGAVEVDENGLAPWVPDSHDRKPSDSVRFLFTGGSNGLKGWPVLAAALPRLPPDGWRLTVYGVDLPTTTPLPDAVAARVRLRPAYQPDELARILAVHDVLVVPSIMRESQSVVTREALQAGLSVVCTDSLGPEEVVRDGVNGRVVPAADPVALGRTLADVVQDRAALRGTSVPALRTVDDHVAGLEERYEQLRRVGGRPDMGWRPRRVLFVSGIDGAMLRYRAELPAEALRLRGVHADVRHYRDASVPALARRADAVVVYRVPATTQILDVLADLRTRPDPPPVIADIDDLIFDPSLRGTLPGLAVLAPDEEELWWQGVRRYRTTIEHADAFVTTTTTLAGRAAELTGLPVSVWSNGVGVVMGRAADAALARARRPGPLRVGYFSGTDTHDHDWAQVEQTVVDALLRHPDAELWLGGHLRTSRALLALGGRVRRLPFLPWTDLVGVLRDLDVNLAPLVTGDVFNESKSAIKWLEAALVQTPTIASPTEPFRAAVTSGRNGLLAASPDEWSGAIADLLGDDVLRARLGARARRDALLQLSPHLQGERYERILAAARAGLQQSGPRMPTGGWADEALDEPWSRRPLEPYDAADLDDDVRAAVVRARRALRGARQTTAPYAAGLRRRAGRAARAAGLRR